MKLEFIGTGAGVPSQHRNVSCTILSMLDEINEMWMFDCGEATQQQILKTNLRPRKVTKIFITHLHGDHLYGLPGFLSSRSFQGGENSPVSIYGPVGLKQYLTTIFRISKTKLSYPIQIIELEESGICFQDEKFTVRYDTLDHVIKCFGYRVEESPIQGELLIDKAREAGVPNGPLLGKLKNREIITLENGTILDGHDFVGEDRLGRVVTVFGDTRYCERVAYLAQDADAFVHEATYKGGEEKMAYRYFHATSVQAAKLAKQAKAKKLYLSHISARYLGKEVKQLEKQAQKVFPHSHAVYDFEEVEVPYPEGD